MAWPTWNAAVHMNNPLHLCRNSVCLSSHETPPCSAAGLNRLPCAPNLLASCSFHPAPWPPSLVFVVLQFVAPPAEHILGGVGIAIKVWGGGGGGRGALEGGVRWAPVTDGKGENARGKLPRCRPSLLQLLACTPCLRRFAQAARMRAARGAEPTCKVAFAEGPSRSIPADQRCQGRRLS